MLGCQRKCQKLCPIKGKNKCKIECHHVRYKMPDRIPEKRQNISQIECLLVGITPRKSFLWELSRPILLVASLRRKLNFCDGYIHIKARHSIGACKASYPTRRVRSVSAVVQTMCELNIFFRHLPGEDP